MDTDALKAFIAVAQTRSFSVAAERLHLTQPAISKRIANLETRLDHPLFDRLGREIRLTEAGERLLPQAEDILRAITDTERSIRELSGEIAGTLRVATSHHIGLHYLPPVLREFALRHRQVQLQFEFLDSEQAQERVIAGDCELAVVTLAPKIMPPLVSEIIWPDPLVFVAAAHHELAYMVNVSLKQLSTIPAILPDLNTFTGRIVKEAFDRSGYKLQINMATNYLETIKVMVAAGLGWSVLPRTMLDDQLAVIPITRIRLKRELGIVTHAKRTLGNAATAFYNVLKDNSAQVN